MLASVMEFLNVWKSGKEASLSLECRDGKSTMSFKVSLDGPDQPHFQHGRRRERRKKKSANRTQKDNARAAAFRAARGAPAAPAGPTTTSPPPPARLAISQAFSTSFVPPPTAHKSTSTAATSQETSPEVLTESGKRRKVWEPSELDSTLAGQRETLPLSPVVQQHHHRHLFSPGVLREEPTTISPPLRARLVISPASSTSFVPAPTAHKSTSTARRATSPALSTNHSARPLPVIQAVTSQDLPPSAPSPPPPARLATSPEPSVWEPSELDHTMAGQRETLSFSLPDPNHPVHHLFAREELREEPQDVDSYIESPQPAVTRESPGPHLSSPRQVPEDSEALPTELVHLPNGTDLQRMQKLELCSRVPPHSCREYWSTLTDEEDKQLDKWLDQCNEQTQGDPRPDIEADEEGYLPLSFSCSWLRDLRYLSLRHNQLLHHGPVTALTSHCPTAKKDE